MYAGCWLFVLLPCRWRNLQSCFFCIIHVMSRKSGKIVLCLVELSSALFPPCRDVIPFECSPFEYSCFPSWFMHVSLTKCCWECSLWKLSKVSDGKFYCKRGEIRTKFPIWKCQKFWCVLVLRARLRLIFPIHQININFHSIWQRHEMK
jgi:hypothetical protein